MKTVAMAAVCTIAALAAAGFAWQRHEALAATEVELTRINAELQKASTDLRSKSAELEALRKQAAEQEMALGQLQAELAAAKSFVEAEKAVAVRLREELANAKETKGRTVQPRPTALRAAPAGRAAGAPAAGH